MVSLQSSRRTFLAVAVLSLPIGGKAIAARLQAGGEERAVRAAVEQYLKGHATGVADEMRKAFLPTAHIEGLRSGTFTSWTAEEYSSRFAGRPAPDESSRKRTIDHIEASGTAAMASATLVHGATTFTDYFVLLKVDGAWKIANKVYSSRPTAGASPGAKD